MTADLAEAPDLIRALVSGLEAEGFALAGQRGNGLVNRLVELRRGPMGVRVTADRGQWWVELGGQPLGDWFDPDVWEACLDNVPVPMEPSELEVQVHFVRHRWHEVANRLDSADVARCLDRKRSTRARTRLGLPPRIENEED